MTTEHEQQTGEEADDAAKWASIEAEAAAVEASAPVPGQVQHQPTNTANELFGALQMLRLMASPLFADWPQFEKVWSDHVLQATATHGGAIMDRHGWQMSAVLEQWGPYIGLVGAVAMPSMATYQHLKLKRLEAERKAEEEARRGGNQQAGN